MLAPAIAQARRRGVQPAQPPSSSLRSASQGHEAVEDGTEDAGDLGGRPASPTVRDHSTSDSGRGPPARRPLRGALGARRPARAERPYHPQSRSCPRSRSTSAKGGGGPLWTTRRGERHDPETHHGRYQRRRSVHLPSSATNRHRRGPYSKRAVSFERRGSITRARHPRGHQPARGIDSPETRWIRRSPRTGHAVDAWPTAAR